MIFVKGKCMSLFVTLTKLLPALVCSQSVFTQALLMQTLLFCPVVLITRKIMLFFLL